MEYKDYYKVMGLARNASADDIKRAYRKLARKYHPDVSKEANAEEKFKELGEAYDVLSTPEKRQAYDQLGANWKSGQEFKPPPGWQHQAREEYQQYDNISDLFDSLFGGGFNKRHQQQRQPFSMPGEDYHAKILVNLEDAYQGAIKEIRIPITSINANGQPQSTDRTLKVKIPAGVKQGQQIRLSGQGGPAVGGGQAGDLYLEIELQKHPLFDVNGNDIYFSLPVTPWEAALGAKVLVPTLAGKVHLTIPPASQGGQKLRLKGRGLPGDNPGDQYVILKIIIPEPKTDNAKALYEKMAQEMPFNPRENLEA